jgi:predicted transcriptional regulator
LKFNPKLLSPKINDEIIIQELRNAIKKEKNNLKNNVINVIKKVVNTQVDSQETRSTLNTIIDFTLPIVIDNLVSAINGEIKFNKEKVKSFSLMQKKK